jgi:hypothetical protein
MRAPDRHLERVHVIPICIGRLLKISVFLTQWLNGDVCLLDISGQVACVDNKFCVPSDRLVSFFEMFRASCHGTMMHIIVSLLFLFLTLCC